MTTITVKNIPPELYERLKQRAAENRRSINSEVIVCIERAVQGSTPRNVDEIIATARKLRESTKGYLLTDEELDRIKKTGRP